MILARANAELDMIFHGATAFSTFHHGLNIHYAGVHFVFCFVFHKMSLASCCHVTELVTSSLFSPRNDFETFEATGQGVLYHEHLYIHIRLMHNTSHESQINTRLNNYWERKPHGKRISYPNSRALRERKRLENKNRNECQCQCQQSLHFSVLSTPF